MIYQHPLAYLLGIEGIALLRGWAGDHDREFVLRRLAEVRRLLDDPALAEHPGVLVRRGDAETGYDQWASSYDDEPRNGLFDFDEPFLHEILDGLPTGTVLDAACGTGRITAQLAVRGGQSLVGVDRSAGMVARARVRVPEATFLVGDLDRLPVADGTVDTVVSALALSHLPALEPVMAEFARVLRPGGHLVISDTHHELIFRGSVVKALGPAGEPGLVATYRHSAGDFLRAALPLGLQVRRFAEPRIPDDDAPLPEPQTAVGPWDDWPWSLMELIPEGMRGAGGIPLTMIWHFQLARPST